MTGNKEFITETDLTPLGLLVSTWKLSQLVISLNQEQKSDMKQARTRTNESYRDKLKPMRTN